jgi:hypothetical protein
MKKALLALSILLVLLFATNPGLSVHKEAALEEMKTRFADANGAKMAATLGADYIATTVEKTVAQRVGRKNYGLFSITQRRMVDFPNPITGQVDVDNVGIGILGQVYLWSGM